MMSPSWCCASPTKVYLAHLLKEVERLRTPDLSYLKTSALKTSALIRALTV